MISSVINPRIVPLPTMPLIIPYSSPHTIPHDELTKRRHSVGSAFGTWRSREKRRTRARLEAENSRRELASLRSARPARIARASTRISSWWVPTKDPAILDRSIEPSPSPGRSGNRPRIKVSASSRNGSKAIASFPST